MQLTQSSSPAPQAETVHRALRAYRQGRLNEALDLLDDIGPAAGSVDLRLRLLTTRAALLRELCDVQGAIAALERAAALGAANGVRLRSAMLLPPIMGTRAEVAVDRARIERDLLALGNELPRVDGPLGSLPTPDFYSVYHGLDDRSLREGFARALLASCPRLTHVAPHCRDGAVNTSRPRIGFISSFFRNHTIGHLNDMLVTGLSAEAFDPVAIFVGGIQDKKAAGIAAGAHRSLEVPRDLDVARQRIAELELDVLHYTDIGMDDFTYLLAFSRLAPVQSVTWGHPVTTGIDTIDDFLSSDALEGVGSEAQYSERLVKLEDPMVCYRRPLATDAAPTRAALGLPDEVALDVCPQSLFKLHPDFDDVLACILRRDPTGLLVLMEPRYEEWRGRFLRRLGARVPDVERRVLFMPPMTRERYLGLLALASVVLDPLHFGGGNSSLEAFAMGSPIVTLPSAFLRGRITAACYHVMGIDDGVVGDAEAYVELALRIARDDECRAWMRQRILDTRDALFERREAIVAHETYFAAAVSARA